MKSFKEIISIKPENSYPNDVFQEFSLISIDKKNSFPIGSYSYRIQKYPSDIDLLEEVIGCCSIDEVINEFVKHIQEIVQNILSKDLHFFMEVKAGVDQRFLIDLHNYENTMQIVNNLYKENLISEEEYNLILSAKDLFTIDEILRDHYVIRWSAEDILKGYKILPGETLITLAQAMKQKSKINIEIIGYVNGRFIDISNFFILGLKEPNGKIKVINLPQEIYDNFDEYFIRTLEEAIIKLSDDGEYFKVIKRMWSLARFQKDTRTISKLQKIITGDVSSLNQVKSDLGAIIKLYKKSFNPPNNLVIKELNEMKDRLSVNQMINGNELIKYNEVLDLAANLITDGNYEESVAYLENLMNIFKNKVNEKAKLFLQY
jgi:hypothetical protein